MQINGIDRGNRKRITSWGYRKLLKCQIIHVLQLILE